LIYAYNVAPKSQSLSSVLREMILIGMEDKRLPELKFLPRAIKCGFKRIAIISPNTYFNKVAVESASYKVDKDQLTISFFDSKVEAVEWRRAEQ
jgi:hypothetical protein